MFNFWVLDNFVQCIIHDLMYIIQTIDLFLYDNYEIQIPADMQTFFVVLFTLIVVFFVVWFCYKVIFNLIIKLIKLFFGR